LKRITLEAFLRSLETLSEVVTIVPAFGLRARAPIDRMLAIK
jgi:quinolinate synthase